MLSIGLMSGTSMDGIDAALIETDGAPHSIKFLGKTTLSYKPEFKILLKAAEYTVRSYAGDLPQAHHQFWSKLHEYLTNELQIKAFQLDQQIKSLNKYLRGTESNNPITLSEVIAHSSDLHAITVKDLLSKTNHLPKDIQVVGYHGQTFYHNPAKKISITVGDGLHLAQTLNITVVNDFRRQDIEAGGQGAPFAPLYHYALAIRDHKIPVAVVNCGGIANITLATSEEENDLLSFDTGPGNGLIDLLVRRRTHGKEHMDYNGKYGNKGKINEQVLTALHHKAVFKNGRHYLSMPPPKSLDIGDLSLIPELEDLILEDACATLEAFTAETIVNSLSLVKLPIPKFWILAGGGWQNPVIIRALKQRLHQKLTVEPVIQTATEAGWDNQSLEAQIFAYFAVRSLLNKPLSLPGTTGVPRPMTGGAIHLPGSNQ